MKDRESRQIAHATRKEIALAVGSKSGLADKELTARFVPPARRELPHLLCSKDTKPDVPDGGTMCLRTTGPSRSSRELSRFLASIDSLGVDALFEDRTRQVGRLRQAIARDRAVVGATQNEVAPLRDVASLSAALACPAGHWMANLAVTSEGCCAARGSAPGKLVEDDLGPGTQDLDANEQSFTLTAAASLLPGSEWELLYPISSRITLAR